MSSQSSSSDAHSMKDVGREGRLSFRNFKEHQLRNDFKRDAMKACDLPMRAFAECSKQEGLWVVFRCKEFQKAVQDCMAVYNSAERFELYKREHGMADDPSPAASAAQK